MTRDDDDVEVTPDALLITAKIDHEHTEAKGSVQVPPRRKK